MHKGGSEELFVWLLSLKKKKQNLGITCRYIRRYVLRFHESLQTHSQQTCHRLYLAPSCPIIITGHWTAIEITNTFLLLYPGSIAFFQNSFCLYFLLSYFDTGFLYPPRLKAHSLKRAMLNSAKLFFKQKYVQNSECRYSSLMSYLDGFCSGGWKYYTFYYYFCILRFLWAISCDRLMKLLQRLYFTFICR